MLFNDAFRPSLTELAELIKTADAENFMIFRWQPDKKLRYYQTGAGRHDAGDRCDGLESFACKREDS